jgi:hypothetical protein
LAKTASGNSPSISISATGVAARRSRPTWKVAMLMPASPSSRGEAADETGLVEIGDVDHRRPNSASTRMPLMSTMRGLPSA